MKKQIEVFGKIIPIKKVKKMPPGYEDAIGLYFYVEKEIWVKSGLPKYLENEVVLHEIYHAIFDRLGFRQTNISPEIQEMLCEAFSRFCAENMKFK